MPDTNRHPMQEINAILSVNPVYADLRFVTKNIPSLNNRRNLNFSDQTEFNATNFFTGMLLRDFEKRGFVCVNDFLLKSDSCKVLNCYATIYEDCPTYIVTDEFGLVKEICIYMDNQIFQYEIELDGLEPVNVKEHIIEVLREEDTGLILGEHQMIEKRFEQLSAGKYVIHREKYWSEKYGEQMSLVETLSDCRMYKEAPRRYVHPLFRESLN